MIRIVLCLFFITFSSSSFAQFKKLEKAKRNIADRDWEDAEKFLKKYLEDNGATVEYSYVSALLDYHRTSSLESYERLLLVFRSCSAALGTYDAETLKSACEDLQFCKDSVKRYENRVEDVIYEFYKKEKSLSSIKNYLIKYPGSRRLSDARFLRDSLAYNEIKLSENTTDFKNYISEYPSSAYITAARENIFRIEFAKAKSENSVESYDTYLKNYPSSTYAEEAKNLLEDASWKLTKELNNKNSYSDFCGRFPNSKYQKEALVKLEEFEWAEIVSAPFDLKLEQFMAKYPGSSHIAEAKALFDKVVVKVLPYLKSNRKYVLVDAKSGEKISIDEYDEVSYLQTSAFLIKKDGKSGIMSTKGNVVIPPIYKCFANEDKYFYSYSIKNKRGLLSLEGKELLPAKYGYFNLVYETKKNNAAPNCLYVIYYEVKSESKSLYGMISAMGTTVFPCIYDNIYSLSDERFVLTKGKESYIADVSGKKLGNSYSGVWYSSENYCTVIKNSKYGLCDLQGKEIIVPKYDYLSSGKSGEFIVGLNGETGIINLKGEVIVPFTTAKSITYLCDDIYGINKYSDYYPKYSLYDTKLKSEIKSGEVFSTFSKVFDKYYYAESFDRVRFFDFNFKMLKEIMKDKADEPEEEMEYGGNDEHQGDGFYEEEDVCYLYPSEMEDYYKVEKYEKSLYSFYVNERAFVLDENLQDVYAGKFSSVNDFYKGITTAYISSVSNGRNVVIDRSGRILFDNMSSMSYSKFNSLNEDKVKISYYNAGNNYEIYDLKSGKSYQLDKSIKTYNDYGSFKCYTFKDALIFETASGNKLVSSAIEYNKFDADQILSKSSTAFYDKNYDECIRLSNEALKIFPSYSSANFWISKSYFEKGMHSDALSYVNKAIQYPYDNSEMYSLLVHRIEIYKKQNNNVSVAKDYLELVKISESYSKSGYYFSAGWYFGEAGENNLSIDAYLNCIKLDASYSLAYNNAGVAYDKLGDKVKALDFYKKAVIKSEGTGDSNRGLYYNNCGLTLYNMGRLADACESFQRASDLGYEQGTSNYNTYCR